MVNSNFHDYRASRLSESPEVFVSIIENEEAPGGVGNWECRRLCQHFATLSFQQLENVFVTYQLPANSFNNCDQLSWSFFEQEMFPCDIYIRCFE